MRQDDFTRPSGALLPTLGGQLTFVPDPLPPDIGLAAIAMSMSRAMQAIGELKGVCRRLQNPYILVRPLQRQEAITSSAMEGTFTTDDDLLLAEAGVGRETDDSSREVFNYLTALDESLSLLKELPISHRVIRRAHEILLSDLSAGRGVRKRPGEYKTEQNWIGGRKIELARYVPPPPPEAQRCMDALEQYINRADRNYPTPLMDMALVHYQIEAIHPFADGNGRVGRMLISLMAMHSGLLDMPILYVSPVMEKYKDEYIDLMYSVSCRSEWDAWLNFFFDRIAESCRGAVVTIDRIIDLQSLFRKRAGEVSRSASIITLVDLLFERTVISVNDARERLDVSYAAAKTAIDRLVSIGVLTHLQGTYPNLYFSAQIRRASRPIEEQPLAASQS